MNKDAPHIGAVGARDTTTEPDLLRTWSSVMKMVRVPPRTKPDHEEGKAK